jgi:hypothetical protein
MVGSSHEEVGGLAAGRVRILVALVAFVVALAVMPSVLAGTLLIAGPLAGPEPNVAWLGQILESLNSLRLGVGAGLLLTLPLLGEEGRLITPTLTLPLQGEEKG